jgi:ribosome-associated toxin RatA of RatAB toxin-antitoxin module
MYSANTIHVAADPARMFALAATVENWPLLLPHYRWVRVLGRRGPLTVLDMAARRGAIPLRWQAVQGVYPAERLITYRHVGGITRGMRVVWQLVPEVDGVEVTIRHRFQPAWPLVSDALVQRVVGDYFVEHVAGQTLQHLRRHAEADAAERDVLPGRVT